MAGEKEIGEFELIDRIVSMLPQEGPGLVKGSGDDCAVFDVPDGFSVVATCDSLIEGVHFISGTDPFLVGQKAVAVNISDIAAMGAVPAFLLVSLALPAGTPASFSQSLCAGMAREAGLWGAAIIGGNMAKSPKAVVIDITCLGRVEKGKALYRSGAAEGDVIAVTGHPGNSAAGLALLLSPEASVDEASRNELILAHLSPSPRVAEGRKLSASGFVSACLDISDGLVADLGHILDQSDKGAKIFIDLIPVSCALKTAARSLGKDPSDFALYGGEDYELCFTLPEARFKKLQEKFEAAALAPITAIGRVTGSRGAIKLIDSTGSERALKNERGWDHFRR